MILLIQGNHILKKIKNKMTIKIKLAKIKKKYQKKEKVSTSII